MKEKHNKNKSNCYINWISEIAFFFFFLPIFGHGIATIVQKNFFLPPYFGNGIATNQLEDFFFSSYFGNAIATITKIFFFFLFRRWYCRNCFFFSRTGRNLGKGMSVTMLPKFLFFLSPPFSLSLSYFCWILATLLPKFFLFPQFPN